ncbi:MerR family transcriptional regulator [Enterococcus alcedinis]|nr:MerR family transcriptional regulator [Enterococcus alcedinis]MBP2102452.1 MerR family Zn(II)-responsive transcriptional regulator of zntA [Enterococcus alcedinis]
MNIQETAILTNLTKETIRYYEKVGLLSPQRQTNGYRDYQSKDIKDLHFIRKMKLLNVPLSDIAVLIKLKNQETSFICKKETLRFIDTFSEQLNEQRHLLNTAASIVNQIRDIVETPEGGDEKQVIALLEKFEGEIL